MPGTAVVGGDVELGDGQRLIENPQRGKWNLVVDDGLEQTAAFSILFGCFALRAELADEDGLVQLARNRHGHIKSLVIVLVSVQADTADRIGVDLG